MLPDGAHARAEDWTIFFLKDSNSEPQRPETALSSRSRSSSLAPSRQNQMGENEDELDRERERERSTSPLPSSSNRSSGREKGGLTYVLNLVRTKHDNTVRR